MQQRCHSSKQQQQQATAAASYSSSKQQQQQATAAASNSSSKQQIIRDQSNPTLPASDFHLCSSTSFAILNLVLSIVSMFWWKKLKGVGVKFFNIS
jgi:hypothetical protein